VIFDTQEYPALGPVPSISSEEWLDLLTDGFAHIRRFFGQTTCSLAANEANSVATDWSPHAVGEVRQRLCTSRFSSPQTPRGLRWVIDLLSSALNGPLEKCVGPESRSWPNEITVAHYDQEGGISAHRDHNRYLWVIAVISLEGTGLMKIVEDRSATKVIDEFVVEPGDLVLLGAAGLAQRPLHSISTLTALRTSISLRYDSNYHVSATP
jgi:hypothetical protein